MIVGVTGATGVVYAVRALDVLRELGFQTHLIVSKAAELTREYETGLSRKDLADRADHVWAMSDVEAPLNLIHRRNMTTVVQDRDEISVFTQTGRHIGFMYEKYDAMNKPMPVTVSMGISPVEYMAISFEPPADPEFLWSSVDHGISTETITVPWDMRDRFLRAPFQDVDVRKFLPDRTGD